MIFDQRFFYDLLDATRSLFMICFVIFDQHLLLFMMCSMIFDQHLFLFMIRLMIFDQNLILFDGFDDIRSTPLTCHDLLDDI